MSASAIIDLLPHGYKPDPHPHTDHTYKVVSGAPITLRLWPQGGSNAPWLFWVHGGGFCGGYAERIAGWIHQGFKGFHIVSVSYRLCPQVRFEDQLEDLSDAWGWCHSNLASVLSSNGSSIDLSRSVIGGDSAGGVFASLSGFGFGFEPQPKVIVNLYGPVDLSHQSFHQQLENVAELIAKIGYSEPRSEQTFRTALLDNDPTKAISVAPWWWDLSIPVERLRLFLDLPELEITEDHRLRMDLYQYMSATRTRFSSVFRKHECSSEAEFKTRLDSYSSQHLIDSVGPYPPTFLLHGTADSAAPIGPSQEFHAKLKARGIPTEARWVDGAEHSFDAFIKGPDDPAWQHIEPVIAFVEKHLNHA